jgi:hypothetical protein
MPLASSSRVQQGGGRHLLGPTAAPHDGRTGPFHLGRNTVQSPDNRSASELADIGLWYAQLRQKLALAVRNRGVNSIKAAAFDRTMRELLQVRDRYRLFSSSESILPHQPVP